jgi:predicted phage tail protein
MGKFLALIILGLSLSSCSWLKSASVQAALNSVVTAGCGEQTKILTGLSQSIGKTLNCTHPDAIQTSLTAALGNVNLCKYAPSATGAGPKGVIGNIVCPVAVSTAIGFMTSAIPAEWGCTVSADAGGVGATLTSICEAAVPI